MIDKSFIASCKCCFVVKISGVNLEMLTGLSAAKVGASTSLSFRSRSNVSDNSFTLAPSSLSVGLKFADAMVAIQTEIFVW
jgi:hypothetical protein